MPEAYHDAFYGLMSGACLIALLVFWQKSPTLIARADGVLYWILRGLFIFAFAGFFWGSSSLGSFDMLGVKRLMKHITRRPDTQQQFMVRGPYRWVRHPLYLFLIVVIWSCPVLYLDRLLFNVLWTLWIVIGTYLEDRDLHHQFGSRYCEYSSKVPMLVPYKTPVNGS